MNQQTALENLFSPATRTQLVELRHDLHRHPELAFEEEQTAAKLHASLDALQPKTLERVAGTGVVARIAGSDPGAPVVALRGDIDALPIQEDTGLEFASERPGVMHACGHDVHATWAIGAAHLLGHHPARGDVLVVLQPAEETGGGAPRVLESGILDDVRAIFGAHVDRRFQVGEVVADAGPLAAAADMFTVELKGSGAHGARPHEGIDPIVGAAAIITELQAVVSRRIDPAKAAVVSVGDTRKVLHDEVRHVVESTAAAHHLEVAIEIELGTPPIVNREEHVAWARRAATALLGDGALRPLGTPNMGGEDFAFYLEKLPGCFLRVGAREPGGEVIPAHSPRFYAADDAIFVGAAVLAETARIASAELR
jgi:hippurate hydrolase